MLSVREAGPADHAAVVDIWNHYIRDTDVTFTTAEKAPADVARLSPLWVAEDTSGVVGFGTYGSFRGGPGYRDVAEHSVYLALGYEGRGAGRALVHALEDAARAAGLVALIGAVSGSNSAALAFHRRMGFQEVGRLPNVGVKHGLRLDLVLVQKNLT